MADHEGDPGVGTGRAPTSRTPRWVKVSGVITIVVVVLFVLLFVIRGPHRGPGGHGPSRHSSLSLVAAHGAALP